MRIAGIDIRKNSLLVRKHIGYLPENTPLYMEMTVEEHLKHIAHLRGISRKSLKTEIDRVADMCSLDDVFYRPVSVLSKGYRQRVGLALALLHNPDILILDEPTSGLDPRQILEIRNLIKSIGKEKTIILSSHILSEVSATCDRVVIIHQGRIAGKGTTDELQASKNNEGILIVTIRGPYNNVKESIEKMPQTQVIKSEIRLDENLYRFEIKVKIEGSPEETMFLIARNNNFILSELHLKRISLEEVFLSLTGGDGTSVDFTEKIS